MSKILKETRLLEDEIFHIQLIKPPVSQKRRNDEIEKNLQSYNEEKAKKDIEKLIEESYQKATKIITDANKKAEDIINESKKQAKKIEQDGYNIGFNKGKIEGEKKIKELYAKELDEISSVKKNIYKEKQEILKLAENDIVKLSLAIATKILPSLSSSKDKIIDLIKTSLEKFQKDENIIIKVSPDNYEIAIEKQENIMKEISGIKDMTILKDISLDNSSCIIEGDTGNVKTSINEQFDAIKKSILGENNEK